MQCHQLEKFVLGLIAGKSTPQVQAEMQAHRANCLKCAQFYQNYVHLRQQIKSQLSISAPETLVKNTLAVCHQELDRDPAFRPVSTVQLRLQRVIAGILFLITILGLWWLLPVIYNFVQNSRLTFPVFCLIGVIGQNLIMLLVMPLILNRYKPVRNWSFQLN
jgi:hypothetical protein